MPRARKKAPDLAASYDKAKEFSGKRYTGMAVGRTHHWYYDKGNWKEKKVTPDKWEISYHTMKRRAGRAPEGSGVPVGTGYHWFILAHQFVEKHNANDYMTHMVGLKFKLAHKRADKSGWNSSANKQKTQLVEIFKCMIAELEREPEQLVPVPLAFEYKGKQYDGTAVPVPTSCAEGMCLSLDITLNGKHIGVLRKRDDGWRLSELKPQGLVTALGAQIEAHYQYA